MHWTKRIVSGAISLFLGAVALFAAGQIALAQSTARPATCEPFNFCSGTGSWRARLGIEFDDALALSEQVEF